MASFRRWFKRAESTVPLRTGNLSQALVAVVKREAHDQLEDGRARLQVGAQAHDPLIVLEPTSSMASPLEISIDAPYLVTCFPGRNGMSCEFFSKKQPEIEEEVGTLVKAVVNGLYSERINDSGQAKVFARWTDGATAESAGLNVFREPKNDAEGWRLVEYQPY